MSVLANAAHANKQVIYATTNDGKVIARQLIAINRDYKLIGFDTYMNLSNTGIDRDAMKAQFDSYVRKISDRCGIKMAFEEEPAAPQSLGNHSWYDDGTMDWPSQLYFSISTMEA